MVSKLKDLKNHKGFIRYLKNTSWLFGEKILRMVVGLFVLVWVARYLGPDQFGLFSYAESFVGLFAAIATLGLDGIVVRELVKDKSRRAEIIGTAFWLKLMGAIGILVTLAIAVSFTSNDSYTNTIIFIIASAVIFQSFNVIDFYFQSEVLSKYVAFANVISLLLSSIIKITLILYEAPLMAFAWAILFDSFILACGFIYFFSMNSTVKIKQLKFSSSTAASLLKDSWPLIISGLVVSIYMKVDQIMIKEMINTEAVGQYAAAVKISMATYFLPTVIAVSLFPALIKTKEQGDELYNSRVQMFYDMMIWLGIILVFPLWYFSDLIISVLYGVEYKAANEVFEVTIFILILICISAVHGKWLISEGLQKTVLIYTVTGAIVNVIANFYLIPMFGIIGAAYATVFAQTIPYIWLFRNARTRNQFRMILKSFFPLHLLRRVRE